MYLDKNYYPRVWSRCNPIHAVMDWSKVRKLVRDAINGAEIPAIIIDGELRNGNLITGTHRAAANDILTLLGHDDCLIDWISTDELDLTDEDEEALANGDYEYFDNKFDRA